MHPYTVHVFKPFSVLFPNHNSRIGVVPVSSFSDFLSFLFQASRRVYTCHTKLALLPQHSLFCTSTGSRTQAQGTASPTPPLPQTFLLLRGHPHNASFLRLFHTERLVHSVALLTCLSIASFQIWLPSRMRAPLQCRAPHLHVLLLLILYFVAKSAAAPGDVLFRHDFRGSTYGWTAQSDYNAAVVTKFGLGMMGNGIEGSDTSSAPWFFQAPLEALGDRSAAYDGLLRVTYGHRAFSANGQAPLDSSSPTLGYDLHLISRHLRCNLGAPNVFNRGKPATYYGGVLTYSIGLNDTSWVHSANGSAVFKDTLARCLQGLTGLRVRGGTFAGSETAVLLSFEWVEGANAWFAASNTNTAFTAPRPLPVVIPRSCQTGDVYKIVSTSTISPNRIQFGNVPRICSAATLKLSILQQGVSGVIAAVGDRSIVVFDQFGVALGQIFDRMGDGRVRIVADDGMQSDYLVINADAMSRITSTNFAQFRLSYTPFEAWSAGSMTLQLARAELRYRVTACNAPLATGDLPPSAASPNNLEYAYSGFVDLPVVNPSSHLSFAFWLSGPAASDRTVTRASIYLLSSSSDTVRKQILSISPNLPLSFDAATYASVLLQDMPLYLRSNNSLRLFIDVASRGESPVVSKRWNLRMVAATRNCFVRSFALTQWGRESPSACGGVSCFTDVNSMPALQFVDDYNYALGGTAYSTGGYLPTSASGPLIQPSIGDVAFDEKYDCCFCIACAFWLFSGTLRCSVMPSVS